MFAGIETHLLITRAQTRLKWKDYCILKLYDAIKPNYDGQYWAEFILFKSDQRSKHSRGQQLIDANHQELNQKQVKWIVQGLGCDAAAIHQRSEPVL